MPIASETTTQARHTPELANPPVHGYLCTLEANLDRCAVLAQRIYSFIDYSDSAPDAGLASRSVPLLERLNQDVKLAAWLEVILEKISTWLGVDQFHDGASKPMPLDLAKIVQGGGSIRFSEGQG